MYDVLKEMKTLEGKGRSKEVNYEEAVCIRRQNL